MSETENMLDEKALREWALSECAPFSVASNFVQVWPDTETGDLIEFDRIADPVALTAASERAEWQYLEEIRRARDEFVGSVSEKGRVEGRRQFYRRLTLADEYWLTKFALGYGKLVFHLHYPMAFLDKVIEPGHRELFEAPRGSYKTTVRGIGWLVQAVLRNPQVRILYVSQKEDNAGAKVCEAKQAFLTNKFMRWLWPEHAIETAEQEGSAYHWTTKARTTPQREATWQGAGSLSSQSSRHYEKIRGDDYWDSKCVGNNETMEKTRRNMNLLDPLLESPHSGEIVFLNTRYAFDDPSDELARKPGYKATIVSAITKQGRSLFPEIQPLSMFHAMANGEAEARLLLWQQYMLVPRSTNEDFDVRLLRYLPYSEIRRQEMEGMLATRKMILTDASGSKGKGSDAAALGVVVVDSLRRKTLIEYVCQQMEPSEFVNRCFELWDKWAATGCEGLVMQAAAIDTTIGSFVKEENALRLKGQGQRGRRLGRTLPMIAFSLHAQEKKRRITQALEPLVAAGELYFEPGLPALVELENELKAHPHSQQDHGLDMLSALGDQHLRRVPSYAAPAPPPPTDEEEVQTMRRAVQNGVLETRRAAVRECVAAAETGAED